MIRNVVLVKLKAGQDPAEVAEIQEAFRNLDCPGTPEGWPGVEVGWILKPSVWNQGYATEIGHAVRDYAFGNLHIPHLVSLIHPGNHASIRLAQKIGAIFEGEYDLNGTPHVIYGQDAP